jgi:hypothetical protein
MTVLHKCNCESLTIIAWSYAVANVDDPMLFNERFLNALLEKMDSFNVIQLNRLHQWHLWRQEKSSSIRLPPAFGTKCYEAFISEEPTVSSFQKEVMARLRVIGLRPKEEELTKIGYSLDAIVEVNGNKVGVEVDGPSHFIGKMPTGNTMLKRRQIASLEGIPLVSVPIWKWIELGKDQKQEFLRGLLASKW